MLCQPRPLAVRAHDEGDRPIHEGADMGLHRVAVLGQHRLLDLGDQALIGHVRPVELHLGGLLVQEVVELPLGEGLDRPISREEARGGEELLVPAAGRVPRHQERTLLERLVLVEQLGEIQIGDLPHALTARAHPTDPGVAGPLRDGPVTLLHRHRPGGTHAGDVEGVRARAADVRLGELGEQGAQVGVRIGDGADGGADVRAHPLLVDDDRGGQALQGVHIGPRQLGHEPLHEGAVGLVDHPLRLGGDGAEHERALARAGDPGEDRQPPFGDVEGDVAEVVRPGTAHADQIVGIGRMVGGTGGSRHRAGSSERDGARTIPRSRHCAILGRHPG